MSLPRELSLRDGRLRQQPVREIDALAGYGVQLNGVRIDEGNELCGCSWAITLDLTVRLYANGEAATQVGPALCSE